MTRAKPGTILYDARGYLEGPRVRNGALYCSNTLARSVLRFDELGVKTLVCEVRGVPCGLGFLPDGELIVLEMMQRKLWRWARGALSLYADLSAIAAGTIDDMIVDRAGRVYVGDLGFDLFSTRKPASAAGRLLCIPADGSPRVVAENLDFPNGIAVNGACDRLAVAESGADSVAWFELSRTGDLTLRGRTPDLAEPDGISLAADGKLWVAQFRTGSFSCIDEAGVRHAEIAMPGRRAVACWLSEDERTLFCISAETTHEQLMKGQSTSRLEAIALD